MFALVDCNNFYASCERLFRPDLTNKPIIVLSNNDGCIIARSSEAKLLGIKMGEPFFQVKALCKKEGVVVFSSNYTLYGDLSERVMRVIEASWPDTEIYSIDEAFLDLRSMQAHQVAAFCVDLQKTILKYTGIPTSIGIGKTKTLAKLANHVAKRVLKIPVFNISNQEFWLEQVGAGDIWGIGRAWELKLARKGIVTAADLRNCNAHQIKKDFNIVLMRTALELQGVICHDLQLPEPSNNIIASRSFGQMQTQCISIAEALSAHASRACEKMRRQNLVTRHIQIFLRSNPHRTDLKQYTNVMECKFIHATDDTRIITAAAKRCLEKIYRHGIQYKKTGIMLMELSAKSQVQYDLFSEYDAMEEEKSDKLMQVFDTVNARFGSNTIKLAAVGLSQPWSMNRDMVSPCYTTQWSDLPVVRLI